ncbi:type IV pilus biogenesis protein PilP [Pseudomonas proteolytica]|uniref:type IV pilus biogenesis protein PilP n=1 Tax=Pseudomonas proteolytica TaxID=219574 RepID=UPI00147292D1|nr:type IV pilus biogenesis protein PilP [Pseudomonas proteolytica]NMZ14954.1 type IV pilus biogenesis protein PilP [Pseudomonas proteolytica]
MQKNNSLVFVALSLLLAAPLMADEYVPTFGDMSTMQAQQMFYELKAKRDKSKQDAQSYEVATGASAAAPVTGTGSSVPRLSGVIGSDLNLYGTFVYTSGSQVEARAGDILPGGFRVSSVGVGKAALIKDGKTIQLMQQTQGVDSSSQPFQMTPGLPSPMGQPIMPVMR